MLTLYLKVVKVDKIWKDMKHDLNLIWWLRKESNGKGSCLVKYVTKCIGNALNVLIKQQ
jgi:hypothetical protein